MEIKNFINDYFNKIIIYLIIFLFDFFIYLNIKYFPKNVLRSNEIKPYARYIIDCKHKKRYNLFIIIISFILVYISYSIQIIR